VPNSIATLADQNADVRGLSANYRDPAGAIQQDKAKGELACCFNDIMALHTRNVRNMLLHCQRCWQAEEVCSREE